MGVCGSVIDGKVGKCFVIYDNYMDIILAMMFIKIIIRAGDVSQ